MSENGGLGKLTWLVVGLAISLLSNAVMAGALARAGKQEITIEQHTRDIVALRETQAMILERLASFSAGQLRIEALLMAHMVQGKPE